LPQASWWCIPRQNANATNGVLAQLLRRAVGFLPLLFTIGCDTAGDPHIQQITTAVSQERLRSDVETLAAFGTRHTAGDTDSDTRGIGAARRWLAAEFERISKANGNRLQVSLQTFDYSSDGRRITRDCRIVNVIATLPGTDPTARDRVYLVSAHYDSIPSAPSDYESDAPGANDDGSGTAAVLELARVLSPHRFRATIMFVLFAGEEQGLLGSRLAVEQFQRDGVAIAGVLNNDIIGNTTGTTGAIDAGRVRVFSEGVPTTELDETSSQRRMRAGSFQDAPSRQLARYLDQIADTYCPDLDVMLIDRRDRFGRGGDHIAFNEQGIDAVRLCEVHENYTHQHQNVRIEDGVTYGDLPQFVDFAYLARVTRFNAAALAALASGPAPPEGVEMLTGRLENVTRLHWQPATDPDVAGYEVVWRDTTAPQWQGASTFPPTQTGCVHPLSKDQYLFGVRTVGHSGLRSVAVYPAAVRE